jgi:hypothetical protein
MSEPDLTGNRSGFFLLGNHRCYGFTDHPRPGSRLPETIGRLGGRPIQMEVVCCLVPAACLPEPIPTLGVRLFLGLEDWSKSFGKCRNPRIPSFSKRGRDQSVKPDSGDCE